MSIKTRVMILLPLLLTVAQNTVYSQQTTATPNSVTAKAGSGNKVSSNQPVITPSQDPSAAVSINKADAQTMATELKGIGLKKAQSIIEYREKFGPFSAVEQLLEVPGFGPALIKQNKHRLKL